MTTEKTIAPKASSTDKRRAKLVTLMRGAVDELEALRKRHKATTTDLYKWAYE